jgi:NADH-ubiquinone oxidoreductase chain 5
MYLSIIILPLLGSIVSGFFGRKVGVNGAQFITCLSVISTTILAILAFFETGINNIPVSISLFRWLDSEWFNINWGIQFDSLTVSMLIPVLIISSLVHIYSISYMSADPHNQRFFSYLSLFTFMMIILVTANNYLLMFVGWEGVGVCSYLLVSFWFTRIAANQSSMSAFLTNRVGDCFLTIGMFAILWSLGNLDYATVFSLAPYMNENIITIIGICLLIGAMAKSSQVGLHVWLPMAMEGPTPVSALIHAATMVTAGVYLLIRSSPLLEYSSTVLLLCLWLGALTTVFSSLIGLFQQDIKKVIAYSTMSQLGMMVIAVGLSSYNVALFHLINHAFYKGLLFLGAGSIIHAIGDNQDFRKYGGLIRYLPLTYSVILIASLSLVAFPFMTGFYSKDFILESAYGQFSFSGISVYFIAVIGAMFTTLYSIKVLHLTFLTTPNANIKYYDNKKFNGSIAHEGNIYMTLPLITLAVFSIFFGFITKDIYIGLGSGFFIDNSIFIHPVNEIMINTEFAVSTVFKLLPFVLTISLSILAIILPEYLPENIMNFKLSRLGYNIFGFFNQRFLIEFFYNKYITNLTLDLGGQTTKILDKGSIESLGPIGIQRELMKLSKYIGSLNTSIITSYGLYIVLGFILFILLFYYNFILSIESESWIIFILLLSLLLISFVDFTSPTKYNHLESRIPIPFEKHATKSQVIQSRVLMGRVGINVPPLSPLTGSASFINGMNPK